MQPAAVTRELVAWLFRRRRRWRVSGDSMVPDLWDRDVVLIDTERPVRAGAIVVARHPFKNLSVIKWVKAVDPDGHVRLVSPGGDDSAQFGRVPLATVTGTATAIVAPAARRRLLAG